MKVTEWIMIGSLKLTAYLLMGLAVVCRAIGSTAGYLDHAADYLQDNLPAWLEAWHRMSTRIRGSLLSWIGAGRCVVIQIMEYWRGSWEVRRQLLLEQNGEFDD